MRGRASKTYPHELVPSVLWKMQQRIVRGKKATCQPLRGSLPFSSIQSLRRVCWWRAVWWPAQGDGVQSSWNTLTKNHRDSLTHFVFWRLFFWPHHVPHVGILVPQPGIEPLPLQWKPKVLATGLPGKAWIWCIDAWDWNKEGAHQYLNPTYHLRRNIHSGRHYKVDQIDVSSDLTGVVWLVLFSEILQKTRVVKP